MKYLIILFTILLTSPLFAKVDFRTAYYPAINRAEMAITKDDYQTAFSEYQTAFSAVESPLARDIFNSVACKFLLNDFEGAKPLLLKLARKGIAAEVLEKKEVFLMDNIKNKWNSFKFLYEQIQSMQQERVSNELVEKIKVFDTTYESLKGNTIVFSLDENGKERHMKSRDYELNKTKNVLPKEEYELNNFLNKATSSELFTKAQNTLVNSVISEGFVGEENMFIDDTDFLRNYFGWTIEKYRMRMDFKPNGAYSSDLNPFSIIPDSKRKLFDSSLVESVKLGKIHRDLALKYLFGYRANNKLLFTKINIENIENCSLDLKEKSYSLFYYKRSGQNLDPESQKTLEKLVLSDDNLLFEKAKYKVLKNNYFAMSSDAQMEETTVPNCDIAKQIIEKATIIKE